MLFVKKVYTSRFLKEQALSGLDVDFSFKSQVLEKVILVLKVHLCQSPACLPPYQPAT